jgi:hypothetical protein
MDYFPNLNLGHTQILISIAQFICCFLGLILILLIIFKKLEWIKKVLLSLVTAFILAVPSCMLLDMTAGKNIFKRIHAKNNQHMPKPSVCLEYDPSFSCLHAKYKVSPIVLKKWIEKYKLKENPRNIFQSKTAPNGQRITAKYNSKEEILTIDYYAF